MGDYPYEYSEKELELFETLNMLDMLKSPSLAPYLAYRQAAYMCFMEDKRVPESVKTAVRNALGELNNTQNQTIFRKTPEWEELINF